MQTKAATSSPMTRRPILKLPDPSLGTPASLLPRSCLVDRITLEEAEELLAGSLTSTWTLAAPPRTDLSAPWEEVKAGLCPGDELWTYETHAECETRSRIHKGIALVRRRRVIASLKTGTRYYWW